MSPVLSRPHDHGALVGSDIADTSAALYGPREASIPPHAINHRLVRGAVARSGRWYCEFDAISGADTTGFTLYGVAMLTAAASGTVPLYGSQATCWGGGDDAPHFNFTGAARLMMAVDTISRGIWIGNDGNWITSNPNMTVTPFATMAATVCGPLAPAIGTYAGAITNRAAICFTRNQMRYEPPTNFIPIGDI